ncbi:hypothetical protein Pcinc_018239 [Petrolisthes cinctipes]|uniref:Uncharacterized protein n=1 Tax=Petrolisthes cinctipes TaxID=88211 RepID=A0AAE1FSI8_PETCI|nr:hypothetical protein Pcinc_018239 [Petrolisthes cinctipes]
MGGRRGGGGGGEATSHIKIHCRATWVSGQGRLYEYVCMYGVGGHRRRRRRTRDVSCVYSLTSPVSSMICGPEDVVVGGVEEEVVVEVERKGDGLVEGMVGGWVLKVVDEHSSTPW